MNKIVNRPRFAAGITDEEYTKWWVECDSERRKHFLQNFGGEVRIEVKIAQAKWEEMKRRRQWAIGIVVAIGGILATIVIALVGCAGADRRCVPTMAELKIGMTKADAISAWCYPYQTTKTDSVIPVFDPASRTLKSGTLVREIWIYAIGPLAGSSLVFDENGRIVTVSEAHSFMRGSRPPGAAEEEAPKTKSVPAA